MQTLLDKSVVRLKTETYLSLVIIIAPLLNFLAGINIDLYAPSLPALAHYYDTSMMLVKNTISANMAGFAIGSILFGSLIDFLGRRSVLLLGLCFYTVASLLALFCSTIEQLIVIRFVQGVMVSTVSIGSRALINDLFTGHRYHVGMIYTSIAWGLGPIIAPFIGGILQYHFGWQANFIAYAVSGILLLIMVALYINESLPTRLPFSFRRTVFNYITVLKHKKFIAGIFIGSNIQFEFMVYPAVGAFLVENILHYNAITYGNSALLASCGYLAGTLTNRILLKKLPLHQLTNIGFFCKIIACVLSLSCALAGELNLFTLVMPITLIGFGNGFVFPNNLARCLKLFPNNIGVALAVFTCVLMMLAAGGVFIISHINVNSLLKLAIIFTVALVLELFVFIKTFGIKETIETKLDADIINLSD